MATVETPPAVETTPEHLDVLIVGAGISGVDAGYRLQETVPDKSYAILEARGEIGGTWDLFRYPGIRSDSDMFTLGFPFRPWTSDRAIVDGTSIREYVQATAREYGIDTKIRFHHRMIGANWSTAEERWTVEVERTDTGQRTQLTCGFLLMCSGYYRYDQGYTPDFPGTEEFRGQIVHPQFWGQDIDYAGKRAVVIGSGATAVTLVPALAEKAEHVTMLQRSPSYILSLPGNDSIASLARRFLSPQRAFGLTRWTHVLGATILFQVSRRRPEWVKKLLRRGVERQLPPGYDVETHFTPSYAPWDQRMCFVPDGDLFDAIRAGKASVVTDQIDRFTETGIRLASGGELKADLVVTATGLILQPLGGAQLRIDGREVDLPSTLIYRGCMFSDIPNFAMSFGYTNASWTLKADLTCQFAARLVRHMADNGYAYCVPRNNDPSMETAPFVDFSSGYFLRSLDQLPKQGTKQPWRLNQNYFIDSLKLKRAPLEDGVLQFVPAGVSAPAAGEPVSAAA
ncbi:MAG TPA: NAD(P)/FAD-dependent oxidoreductase [Solirubrobacteraceae bacterium]|nr:NAD(P)/FAD-dependent oxidoreductase [Solirubrobacteraceae bacterium]